MGSTLWFVEMIAPPESDDVIEIEILPGANSRQIAVVLKQKNVVRSAFLFSFYIRMLAIDNRLRPGKYTFKGQQQFSEVAYNLLKGTVDSVAVTVPEGTTLKQIARILEEHGVCSAVDFIRYASDPELLGNVFSEWELIPHPEGMAFPETYFFTRPTPASRVAKRMLNLTRLRVDEIFVEPLRNGLSQYEACILASIVEREAAVAHERKLIASVFYNRLERNMRLESCATVFYALGRQGGRLLYADLEIESPYNTYKNEGLPPTPIANFGAASMRAVANPADSNYLFFVSDGDRGHRFSTTLAEHNRYRRNYFRQRQKGRQ